MSRRQALGNSSGSDRPMQESAVLPEPPPGMVKEQQKGHCCNTGGRATAKHNLECKELERLILPLTYRSRQESLL